MSKAKDLAKFLNKSHSMFHAVKALEDELLAAGYTRLPENGSWDLQEKGNYYVTRNGSSILAFQLPERKELKGLNIVASHSDSPCFKIKPVWKTGNDRYTKLNVEVYGGLIMSTWFDRPLSIAGRVAIRTENGIASKLVDFDEDLAIIPNVAIHQNRQINDGYKYNAQTDLLPLVCTGGDDSFLEDKICQQLNVKKEDILGFDLYLYNRTPAYLWGKDEEFISAPRLDDLECAYTSLQAFKKAENKKAVNIYAVFDNEEVGSITRQGMASGFLADTITRIFEALGYSESDKLAVMANSFLVSADNAHAVHPNHPELYDSGNQSYMNKGVVIKRCASQSYVTDALSEAVIKQLAEKGKVPYQFFANRSDVRGGGTQAAIGSINISSMAIDIGLPQLAMHSSFETAGSRDVDAMIALLAEFYRHTVICDNGSITLE